MTVSRVATPSWSAPEAVTSLKVEAGGYSPAVARGNSGCVGSWSNRTFSSSRSSVSKMLSS